MQRNRDDAVHILKQNAAHQNDAHIRPEGDVAQRKMGVQGLDCHDDEVRAAGGGILCIDQGVPGARENAGTQCRQQAAASVDRKQRGHIVNNDRRDYHAPHRADKEPLSQKPVAQRRHGDIQQNCGQADGNMEQPA